MASESKSKDVQCTIRPTKGLKEVEDYWWPLMKELQWNRSLHDAHTHLHSATPSSWLMAIPSSSCDTSDTPAGTIVAFTYTNATGWVGFFIVSASHRTYGLGRALFAAALEHFKAVGLKYVGLDGVAEQVGTYERRGFVEAGKIGVYTRGDTKEIPAAKGELWDGERMVDLRDVKTEMLVQSDLANTGLERGRLWSREGVFARKDASGFAVLDDKYPEHALKGWVLIRSCEHGWRVGPVYAHCKEVASLLLWTAMKSLEGKEGSLVAEVWKGNTDSLGVFEDLGWKWGMDYHRMWLDGKVPPEQSERGLAVKEMFATFDAAEG